jgi:hypothetical protein
MALVMAASGWTLVLGLEFVVYGLQFVVCGQVPEPVDRRQAAGSRIRLLI